MISAKIDAIKADLGEAVTLIAVSKTKPKEMIIEAMQNGHVDFGENKVQELVDKHESLPKDIRWHMIGHLQRNKVKYIAPFVHLIHGVDSERLLNEINKQGLRNNRVINCLLQFHIAEETSKFGFSLEEVKSIIAQNKLQELTNVCIKGVMGMATFTDNKNQIETEFKKLASYYNEIKETMGTETFKVISMGMSGDFKIAVDNGSNMVRIGSTIFGPR